MTMHVYTHTSLRPKIGRPTRRWFSSFGTLTVKPKLICSQANYLLHSLDQCNGPEFVGARLAKSTDARFLSTVILMDDTAIHLRNYANSC